MQKTIKLNRFTEGANNVDQDTDLPKGSLREANNVDISRQGRVRRRKGYTQIYSGTNIHSLYKRYFFESGTLKLLNNGNTASDIVSGLSDNPVSYCDVNGVTYWANGDNIGTVEGALGVPDIASVPTVESIPGTFDAGRYQVSFAQVSDTGEVGGATNPIIIELLDGDGIGVRGINYSNAAGVRVYVSAPNGKELFLQTTVYGTDFVDIVTQRDDKETCDTVFMEQMLPGHIVRFFKGRLYVAADNVLWYSESQRLGLYTPSKNFFTFPERITVVQETESGIFVVADMIYFISGTDPRNVNLSMVGNSKGVEGTGISADAKNFNAEFNGKVAYWYSEKGAILGYPNGQIKYITEDRFDAGVISEKGTTGYREQNGIRQMITNLFNQTEDGSAFGASDNVTAEVIRNGAIA